MKRVKLVTKEIEKLLPGICDTADLDFKDIKVPLKIFNPYGAGSWYIYEYEPNEMLGFGFSNLGNDENAELGYISILELETTLVPPLDLHLERDKWWNPNTKLIDILNFQIR